MNKMLWNKWDLFGCQFQLRKTETHCDKNYIIILLLNQILCCFIIWNCLSKMIPINDHTKGFCWESKKKSSMLKFSKFWLLQWLMAVRHVFILRIIGNITYLYTLYCQTCKEAKGLILFKLKIENEKVLITSICSNYKKSVPLSIHTD